MPYPLLMTKPFRLVAPVASEDEFHAALARLLTLLVAKPGVLSPKGVLWYSVEQRFKGGGAMFRGRNGENVPVELANRAKRGVVAGVPDVHFFWNGRCYLIELKREKGLLSKAQRELHPQLRGAGIEVARCDSMDDVVCRLDAWGLPWTFQPSRRT